MKSPRKRNAGVRSREAAAHAAPAAATKRSPRARTPRVEAAPVSAADLRALHRHLERQLAAAAMPAAKPRRRPPASPGLRWNPDPEEVQKSVAQLVLTIVEFLRKLMERQAIRRMEQRTLTPAQVEAVGSALMQLEKTIREIGSRFGVSEEELNLDLGPIKLI